MECSMRFQVRRLLSTAVAMAFATVALASLPGFAGTAASGMHPPFIVKSAEAAGHANVKVFDEVWGRVRDSFYDPNFRGLNWDAIGRKYRPLAAGPGADLAKVINQMLGELSVSHTGYYTPAEIAFYEIADIFAGGSRRELEEDFTAGAVDYVGLRWVTAAIE